MERLQSSLSDAAAKGCVNSLQQLLISDPLILNRCFINRFNETPLHVAAMLGHIDFVKKIIEINPQLVHELNLQKRSPLHLAAATGHVEVVKALLSVDNQVTCLARDRNGLTAVHLAAIKGRDEAVKLLLDAQPDAARMLAYEDKETILHLCVKNYQLQALKLIVTTLNEAEFLNSKDAHGNTALDLAVEDNQVETIKFLMSVGALEVNAEWTTTLDVELQKRSELRDSEIEISLKNAGGFGILEKKMNDDNNDSSTPPARQKSLTKQPYDGWVENKKSSLMVVASLIATMAFQVGANPPAGLLRDDKLVDSLENPVSSPHEAGTSLLFYRYPQLCIIFCSVNTIAFVASLSIILLLMSGWPIRRRIFMWILMVITWIAIIAIALCYAIVITMVTPICKGSWLAMFVIVWIVLIALLLIPCTFRIIVKLVKKIRKVRMRRRRSSNAPACEHVREPIHV